MPAVTTASRTQRAARVTAFGVLAVGALSAGACIIGSSGPEQVDPAAFAWNAPVSAPATVYVRNTNGSVEVKPSTDGNVRVSAEVRWKRGDPKRDLKFETVNGANGPTICALWGGGTCSSSGYQSRSRGMSSKLFGRSTDASVAFTVYVPTGVKVDAFTMNGSIGVAASAPVFARTMNGTIKVATSVGPVDAETVSGDVDVRMTTLGLDGPVRAKSVNGSVSAYLPEKFDGMVEMSTVLGSLTSDFAGAALKGEDKEFSAALGTGGRKVEIGTVTGSAALHKLNANGTVSAP
jgi:Putative adhesin